MPRFGLMVAGQKRILVRPAINEAGYDVNDAEAGGHGAVMKEVWLKSPMRLLKNSSNI
jgi:hypothetical protein